MLKKISVNTLKVSDNIKIIQELKINKILTVSENIWHNRKNEIYVKLVFLLICQIKPDTLKKWGVITDLIIQSLIN